MNTKKTRQRFYMCMTDEGDCPKKRHYNKDDAVKEAERLAKATGEDVFLLEALSFTRYTPPEPPPEISWNSTTSGY